MTWQPEQSGTPFFPIRVVWSLPAAFVVALVTFVFFPSPQAVAAPSNDDYIVLLRADADAPDVARAERRRGNEVEEVFEVPLTHFLDPGNHARHSDERNGRRRHYYSMPYEGRYIWGATAGMLHMLYRVLRA